MKNIEIDLPNKGPIRGDSGECVGDNFSEGVKSSGKVKAVHGGKGPLTFDHNIERLYTREEAAQILRLKTQTLAKWACIGAGPPITKLRGRVLYSDRSLRQFIAEGTLPR